MEASRNKLEADRQFGHQNVESMIEARASKCALFVALYCIIAFLFSGFWNKINQAMERDQLTTADNRNDLANRFQRLRNMMGTAEARDESRRQQNMEAIHHMMSSMSSMSSHAFDPRTYVNFWRKYL